MNTTQSLFTAHYAVARELPFDEAYNNGTGYFDPLMKVDLGLKPGEVVRMWTGDTNRRRLLIVGTQYGNVIVFDRYTDGRDRVAGKCVITSNLPWTLSVMFGGLLEDRPYDINSLGFVLGRMHNDSFNIGKRISYATDPKKFRCGKSEHLVSA